MGAGHAVVDRVLHPLDLIVLGALLIEPVDPEIVGAGIDDVVQAVAVDVDDQDRNAGLFEVEIWMPDPTLLARVLRRFGPTVAANDIHAAIAVDVARAQPVPREFAR